MRSCRAVIVDGPMGSSIENVRGNQFPVARAIRFVRTIGLLGIRRKKTEKQAAHGLFG